jgi:Protein of unknown function DUF115
MKEFDERFGRATVNPYLRLGGVLRESLSDIVSRARWDISQVGRDSRSALLAARDSHLGQKAVIICNGPSLNQTNLEQLAGVFTFGLNKINLLFERSSFRPSCVVAVNPHVLEQNADFYNTTDLPLFLHKDALKWVNARRGVSFLHSVEQRKFARDCSMSLHQGSTVTYVAMQLAYHMGFKKVALVGCDHNFAEKGPPNKTVVAGAADSSHFDPNYFAGGVKWQLPDLIQSEISYITARDVYENTGRELYNSTIGGKLEVLERMSLEDFLRV